MNKIKEFFRMASEEGLKLPFAFDAVSGKPSVTLFFAYVTFLLALTSTILLHFTDKIFTATVTTIIFFVINVIFYLLRRLTKAKVDLDDRSIELDGEEDDKESNQ
jgi:cbb3-type cytochrome oxidase subunit 3